MKKVSKRVVSAFFVLVMVLSILPSGLVMASATTFADPRLPFDRSPVGVYACTYGGNYPEDPNCGHYGTDYRAVDMSWYGCAGTPIYAIESGYVKKDQYGTIIISHDKALKLYDGSRAYSTWYSYYCHMSNLINAYGQYITKGTQIGTLSNQGTGAYHLHFAITTKLFNGGIANGLWNISNKAAVLRDLNTYTISPNWLSGQYRSIKYVPYSGDAADASAIQRILGGTNNAPTSTVDPNENRAPSVTNVSLVSATNIAVGDNAIVNWSAVSGTPTPTYTAGLYNSSDVLVGIKKDVGTGTNVAFAVPSAGTYKIKVTASNSSGSNTGTSASFTAHNPSTVTFLDYDSKVLNTQSVKYGQTALMPAAPSREGYTFSGWDKSFSNIICDLTVNATYQIIIYTIKFTDFYGNILKTDKVPYNLSSTPPENTNPPTGYVFIGWASTNYLNVKSNATIQARYKWGNTNLPIILNITSASRQPDGYYVYFNLTNYPTAITRGRAVVSLKTSEGKLVDTTESAAFSIPANGTKTGMEVFIPCDKAATNLEVLIVNNYSSGVPISEKKSTSINQEGMWSNWSATYPAGDVTIDQRTEYQYRDKQYLVSASSSVEGWTLYNTTSAWGVYGGWSGWSTTPAYNSDSRTVQYRTVTDAPGWTQLHLYYYRYWNSYYNAYYYTYSSSMGGTRYDIYPASTDVRISGTVDGYNKYFKNSGYYNFSSEVWYYASESYIQPVTHTEYSYADRSLIYTYYFYKWPTTWSAWSPALASATSDRQVQTRTTYRYKSTAAATEDNSGTTRTITGKVSNTFASKQASIFIYKVDEASDFTNEFVGQTVIATDGSYSLTYKLREEPTVKTGDFTIALGIEGTTNTIIIGTIEAPKPIHTVEFYDYNGSIVSSQQVNQGEAAVLPANPARVGYTFVGWDTGITNIRDNLIINAVYVVNKYTVVFIDWTNDTVETRTFSYGDILQGPQPAVKEGYNFIGWDALLGGATTVTDNMILTASHQKKTYEVVFYDFDMNIISNQTIPYGETAEIPDALSKPNYIFVSWENTEGLINVTKNMEVKPVFCYEETVATPVASVVSGVYTENQLITLNCATADSEIYFTVDGSDPALTGVKFTSPITVSQSSKLSFVAKASEMNDSNTVSEFYAINKTEMSSRWMPYTELPLFVIDNPTNYNVVSNTGYRYKNILTTHFISTVTFLGETGWSNDGFEYGQFSEWSMEQPDTNNVYIDVETKDPDPVDTPFYRYSHWKYFDDATQSYIISRLEVPDTNGEWEYITLPSVLTINSFESGQPRYLYEGVYWYTQSVVIQGVVPDYDLYRYRYHEYSLSEWTDWSIEAPAVGETRETQTDTVYRYTNLVMYLLNYITYDDIETQLVLANQLINMDIDDWQRDGYTFNGFFIDEACTQPWNLESDVVTGNLTLYPKWTINECSVNFVGYEGSNLGSQTVEYGSFATAPVPATIENYTFLGWDTLFNYVTEDITVTAQYKLTADVMKVALNMTTNVLTIDSMFRIIADVTPAAAENKTLIWTSSDEDIATVDQTGLVTAISVGKATITATTEVDKQSASCEITVLSNGAWNFDFDQTSNLKFIIGLEAGNKVSDLKAQILNTNIRFVDPVGQEMGEDEIVSTGCKVQMVEAQTLVAEKTFVFFGDVNSDGSIDSIDAGVLVDYENYLISWDPVLAAALYAAADVNGDGTIDSIDAGIIVDTENYLVNIDQSTGLASSK